MSRSGALVAALLVGLSLCAAQDNIVVGGNNTSGDQWGVYTAADLDQFWNETGLGDYFSRFVNTFLVGDQVLVQNATETDNICASTCDDSEDCTTWAWCASQSGCKITNAGCETTADVAFRTCILSTYDTLATQNDVDLNTGSAQVGLSGPSVPFISGFYTPTASNPVDWKAPAGKKGWWDRFSVEEATFYGMDGSDVPAAAGSFEECAQRCDETEGCDLWSYCPEDATDGCFVPGYICNTLFTVNAGYCLLGTGGSDGTVSFYKFAANEIVFAAGKRLPVNATA